MTGDRDLQAHNLKVVGSNPTPATISKARWLNELAGFFCAILRICPGWWSFGQVLMKSTLSYPVSSRTGASMS
jgi:hypothetical protein